MDMGIEPMLGPHLGHTVYKTVGASSYTNPSYHPQNPQETNR